MKAELPGLRLATLSQVWIPWNRVELSFQNHSNQVPTPRNRVFDSWKLKLENVLAQFRMTFNAVVIPASENVFVPSFRVAD